jgi:NNP family nitrate/nitrite transporter-like MFS transporter
MAITGGWDASGAGFVQLLVGTIIYPFCIYITNGDTNLARRISLIVAAILALYCVDFFYKYNDNCPLGNYNQVKRVGLMVERCAVDSFQSGAMNVNSWILFFRVSIQCNECTCL